ncbi:MAG: hypothetical protein P8Q14_07730 [Vicingaceae bacterium]|nr:hypothetical protein [Vicingaceae bacterium]
MKKIILMAVIVTAGLSELKAQTEFKIITVIESIVPGGLGRSRIIENGTEIDYNQFTTERTDGKKSSQGKIKRGDAKVDKFSETKILNFYSMAGINFQNVASNDALATSMLNDLSKQGWELMTIAAGVESDAGKGDGNGLFITRYIFKK